MSNPVWGSRAYSKYSVKKLYPTSERLFDFQKGFHFQRSASKCDIFSKRRFKYYYYCSKSAIDSHGCSPLVIIHFYFVSLPPFSILCSLFSFFSVHQHHCESFCFSIITIYLFVLIFICSFSPPFYLPLLLSPPLFHA